MTILPGHIGASVASLMRDVARETVMPRFRALAASEIAEKSPGEVVTIADREAECRLHEGLNALGLDARIVGEEAVADDPALLDGVGEGLVWLVDPLDGTANFAAGRAPFGMMVALVADGEVLAGWILDPLGDRFFHAARGRGATCNGARVHTTTAQRSRPRAALGTHFLPASMRQAVHAHAERFLDVVPVPRCAAASYPRLVLGQDDVAMFQRTLPWDHAPGALFLSEAGGVARHWDGSPYRVGGNGVGMLCAADEQHWEEAAEVLFAPETGLRALCGEPLPSLRMKVAC